MTDEKWNKLDRKVLGSIRLKLADNVSHNVAKVTTAQGEMKVLLNLYVKPTTHNKVSLVKNLFNKTIVEDTPANTHLNSMNNIINQLTTAGFVVNDE
ncbi:hypothetical protein LIER_22796 [Lithospermum erythrorhizon]|uniref:Uncharacterized protein n=1 Tax=Lithospermum erythrorhizon TaxID=34254 RepID=A0AAV3QYS2_LITER